jgi:glycosyltransferase involved in cell wall biosynthesis
MRIVFVLPSLELGGAERQALVLARYLAEEQGAEVQVWGLGEPGRVVSRCIEAGLPWRSIPVPPAGARLQQAKGLLRLVRDLRAVRPDALLPYTMVPNVLCSLIWRWTGARACIWNQRDRGPTRMARWLERRAVQSASHFVSNSRHGVEFLTENFGLAAARIAVIPNGVQLAAPQASRSQWRHSLSVTDSDRLVVMVANLTPLKDHATLLRAWRLAQDRLQGRPDTATLLLAGAYGETYPALQALTRSLDLQSAVRFLGPIDDISGLLSAVDVGVLSSRGEGSPNGVLECMAAGLPVAGTDIPGIREALGEAGQPFLAPPGDAEALAERLLRLLSDPQLRADAGRANRARIAQAFAPRLLCEEMVRLLHPASSTRSA